MNQQDLGVQKRELFEVFYRDENGELKLAASFVDENGVVTTEDIVFDEKTLE